jgi:hypothetical protein
MFDPSFLTEVTPKHEGESLNAVRADVHRRLSAPKDKEKNILKARIELATFCVLSRRHNQLDHSSAKISQKYLYRYLD